MKQEYVIKEYTVICNVTGKVEQIVNYNSREIPIEIGSNFSLLLDKDSRTVFKNFLQSAREHGYALGYVLSINIDNIIQPVCMNAFYKDQKFHISVLIGCRGTLETLYEISRLSEKQVNFVKTAEPSKEASTYVDMLENWVMKDPLTNVFNHRYFNSFIYKEAARAHQKQKRITIISIDFNKLNEYNKEFGFRKGDDLLLNFVAITKNLIRADKDHLFRLGGDEFLLQCTDMNQMKAYRLMEKIEDSLKLYTDYTSISYGIVEISPVDMGEEFDINIYLEEADRKIKQDKKTKKSYMLQYKI